MSPLTSWTFLLLSCLISIVNSEGCIQLRDNHKDLSKKMLDNFQHMIPEGNTSDDCVINVTLPDLRPLYKVYQVDSVVIVVRELFHHILQFYKMHEKELVSNQTAWKKFQEDLDHLFKLLSGCTTEKPLPDHKMSDYFMKLEEIMDEQKDATCTQRIIYENIKYNLLQAIRLSALLRKYSKMAV